MTDRYVVAGNPVAHSRSPLIHARFAAQTGQDMEYRRPLGPPGGCAAPAPGFFAPAGYGVTVTVTLHHHTLPARDPAPAPAGQTARG